MFDINFFPNSREVIEGDQTLQITVSRDRGTYGLVTIFIYSQPIEARWGSDYSFSDQVHICYLIDFY